MHWSQKLAQQVIDAHPKLEEYTVASGISPSGNIHIGNYREFITNWYVAKALTQMGKKVRFIMSWDNYDRLRKVPKNITTAGFEQHIGRALADIPDPDGKPNTYAERFQGEFESALNTLRMNEIPVQFRYQAKEYRSGRYYDGIVKALKNRKKIYDIIQSFKTQEEDEGDRESYYPVTVYCPACKRDSTVVSWCSADGSEIEYTCKCDGKTHRAKVKDADVKLVWKVDWAMRWQAENVVFEAAGIDHHADGGSFQVCSRIVREIYGHFPPETACYAWVGIKGISSGNMSSSSGVNITPATCLSIYEPEILRWLYAKYDHLASFDFGFDDTIVRHYTEFDKGVKAYLEGTLTEEYEKAIYELALFKDTKSHNKVSFGTLATIAPLAEFNEGLIKTMLAKAGVEYTPESKERVEKVEYWLAHYQSEKIYKLRNDFNKEYAATLTNDEKSVLKQLHSFLDKEHNEKEIQEFLYQIINDPAKTKKENVLAQQRYFRIFYNMMFGRDDGPRLYLYLAVADKAKIKPLLVTSK